MTAFRELMRRHVIKSIFRDALKNPAHHKYVLFMHSEMHLLINDDAGTPFLITLDLAGQGNHSCTCYFTIGCHSCAAYHDGHRVCSHIVAAAFHTNHAHLLLPYLTN